MNFNIKGERLAWRSGQDNVRGLHVEILKEHPVVLSVQALAIVMGRRVSILVEWVIDHKGIIMQLCRIEFIEIFKFFPNILLAIKKHTRRVRNRYNMLS